jgi:uncharacterized protein YidB (DUF937 family)
MTALLGLLAVAGYQNRAKILLSRLTRELPAAVDKLTPDGRLPNDDEAERLI